MKFILTDIYYEDEKIVLFGETENSKKVIKKVDFIPYFLSDHCIKTEIGDSKVIKTEKHGNLYKIYVNSPKAVPVIREYYKLKGYKTYEDDIPIVKRFLIDKGLRFLEGVDENLKKCKLNWNPKILAFDIETEGNSSRVDPKTNKIIMISFWSNFGKKGVYVLKKVNKKYATYFSSEKEMLKAFNKILLEKPSIIVTFNGDEFDWPFLRERMNLYKIQRNYGVDNSKIKIIKRKINSIAKIRGIAHIDLYKFFRNIFSAYLKTSTFDLASISEELLDNPKEKMDWNKFYKEWSLGEIDDIVEYSLLDAKVTFNLFMKVKDILFELSKLSNLSLYDVCRAVYSSLVENYLMSRSKEYGVLIPKKPNNEQVLERSKRTYLAAYVHEPKPGIYENIAVLDFRSLYPTIIVSYNICPTTLSDKGKCVKVDGRTHCFSQEKRGFIPYVVYDLIKERAKIKKKLKENYSPLLSARSYAIKTITNAIYGYLAYPRSRWYCYACAESITALGRKHIHEVIKMAHEKGFEVCYGDTDSVFLLLGNKTKKDIIDFVKYVNSKLPGIMELEFERFCKRGFFVKSDEGRGLKKRYALLDESGKIIIKGFEFVRGDWSEISKKTQYAVITALLKDNSKEKAIKILKETIKKLRNNEIPIEDLIIRTQITKPLSQYKSFGPHVVVAKKLEKKGIHVAPGTIVSYVIIQGSGLIRDKAIPPNELGNKKIDAEYYINHQVIPAVSRILSVLGISEKELKTLTKQKKLKDFFS